MIKIINGVMINENNQDVLNAENNQEILKNEEDNSEVLKIENQEVLKNEDNFKVLNSENNQEIFKTEEDNSEVLKIENNQEFLNNENNQEILNDENNQEVLKNKEISKNYDTLVIAGGSSKGIVTLGSVQYLYDNFYLNEVKNYIGTSSGSMVSYLLAIGYTPIEIMVYICCHQLMEKIVHFNIVAMINGNGATSYTSIYESLEKMTIDKIGYLPTLKMLKEKFGKTLVCVTYNETLQKTEYLSYETYPDLPCLIAVKMSSNLPLIFEKCKYNGNYYVDGGLSDNFAIDYADNIGNKVIGILLDMGSENFSKKADIGILEYIYKLIFVPVSMIIENKIKLASDKCKIIRLVYHNDSLNFFNFDINSKDKLDMFSVGYQQTKEIFEQ